MGKSRQRKQGEDRSNPLAKPVKTPSDPELAALHEKKVIPVIKNLTSADSKTRASAAVAITNIIEEAKCRKLLLKEKLVTILLEQTLTDQALESKSAGWRILRNLAAEEDTGFCIHLYRSNILTAIRGAIHSIIEIIESKEHPFSKLPKAQQELVWTMIGSVIGMASSLAESQEEIAQAISKMPVVINFLFGILTFDSVPAELFRDSLFCLATLVEDNEYLAKKIIGHGSWLDGLMQLIEIGGSKAVAACGVLHNIFSTMEWWDEGTPMEGLSDACLIPALVQCMDQLVQQRRLANGSDHSSLDMVLKLALEITASIATSLQEALEYANSIEKEFKRFEDAPDDIGDEVMQENGLERGEEMVGSEDMGDGKTDGEDMDEDMNLVVGADQEKVDQSIHSQPTINALVHMAAPKILSFAKATDGSEEHDEVKTSALSALNNIAWTISSIDFTASSSGISATWATLANRIWTEVVSPVLASNTANIALASSITSIAWAVARNAQGKLQLQGDEQRKFMALYHASKSLHPPTEIEQPNGNASLSDLEKSDAFQSLGVKCIGVLGSIALHPAPIDLNREVGVFLLTVLTALPESPTAECVEALNQIYDIYADKEYEYDQVVFWGNGFYKNLEEIAPKVKKMAKSIDKRKNAELRERADNAALNLGRFLAYKRKEGAS